MRDTTERFEIIGDCLDRGLVPWISAHGRKLGLTCNRFEAAKHRVAFCASGLPDMLDALEMGCSLGPFEVRVDNVDRTALIDEDDGLHKKQAGAT